MKKSISGSVFFAAMIVVFTLSLSIFANSVSAMKLDSEDNKLNKIEEIYGVPLDVLKNLDENTLNTFTIDMEQEDVSYETSYIRFTENPDKTIKTEKFNEAEYLKEMAAQSKQLNAKAIGDSWMRIHLTLRSVSSTHGEASGAFTWLIRPAYRMKDVAGIIIQNGVVTNNSASGFYSYATSQGSKTINWNSGFHYFLGGVTKVQNLAKPDWPVTSDMMFLKFRFNKNKNASEGLYGTYGQQRLSINVSNPVFELSRNNGGLKPLNFSIGVKYKEASNYLNKDW